MKDYNDSEYTWMELDRFAKFLRDNKTNDNLNQFTITFLKSIPDCFDLPKRVVCKLRDVDKYLDDKYGLKVGNNNNLNQTVSLDIDYRTHEIVMTLSEVSLEEENKINVYSSNFYRFVFFEIHEVFKNLSKRK